MLIFKATLIALAMLLPGVAQANESPSQVDTVAQAVQTVDSAVKAQVDKWALNKMGFVAPNQPCYLTKVGSKRSCPFPSAPGSIAVLFKAADFQSYKGKNSWECHYQRPQMAIVLPKMIRRAEAAGLGEDAYIDDLRAALEFLNAWKAAQPELPLMADGGFCNVSIQP